MQSALPNIYVHCTYSLIKTDDIVQYKTTYDDKTTNDPIIRIVTVDDIQARMKGGGGSLCDDLAWGDEGS